MKSRKREESLHGSGRQRGVVSAMLEVRRLRRLRGTRCRITARRLDWCLLGFEVVSSRFGGDGSYRTSRDQASEIHGTYFHFLVLLRFLELIETNARRRNDKSGGDHTYFR